jgi:glycosyltransferase involved in cell wall biosynthesis
VKLSVLMITYNHAPFIAQALESILAQRVNFDYEIVVGEDCSTDGTRAILMDFQRRYPNRIIPLLRNPNMGAIPNMATTFRACRGEYVALLEGDDYWTVEDKLQRQVEFLDTHQDTAICCHRVRFLDEIGILGIDVHPSLAAGSYTLEDLLRTNFVMTCSAMLRRDLIGPLPSWYPRMALGDWPLFAFAAHRGKIELLNEIMATYRVHSGGIWSTRSTTFRRREMARMLGALDKHFNYKYTKIIRPTLAQWHLDLALMERENGNRVGAGKHLLTCIRNGGAEQFPRRMLAGLAAYTLIGSWYKAFSRANEQPTAKVRIK